MCLSGGGVNGFSHLGFIKYLHENKHLIILDTIIGTSIGAVIGFLYFLEITPLEMYDIFLEIDPTSCFNINNMEKFFTTFGIDSGEYFIAKIIDILIQRKIDPLITFAELYKKSQKNLIICATNVDKHSSEYFSYENRSNMKVMDAIRMTTSLPLIFTPVSFENSLYTDGFLTDNFPMQYLIDLYNFNKSNTFLYPENSIIGCCLQSFVPTCNDSFDKYIYNIIGCIRNKQKHPYSVYIPMNSSPLDLGMNSIKKQELYNIGYNQAKKYVLITLPKTQKKIKRHSL
jgi:hypothetical protein